jgi:hypothetical protein
MLRPVSLHFRLLVEMDLSTSVTDQGEGRLDQQGAM